ncbi:MAG: hypothetical protein BA863_08075 [Desulfovibrio sp. S3730MH75]|nr:MAG: hypothetical protein BA863_08075 [Desulfovibrio sp. S3730MH75]
MGITFASGMLIAEAIGKLGLEGWKAYCLANRETADAFSEERIQGLIDDHRDTDEILAEHGIVIPDEG